MKRLGSAGPDVRPGAPVLLGRPRTHRVRLLHGARRAASAHAENAQKRDPKRLASTNESTNNRSSTERQHTAHAGRPVGGVGDGVGPHSRRAERGRKRPRWERPLRFSGRRSSSLPSGVIAQARSTLPFIHRVSVFPSSGLQTVTAPWRNCKGCKDCGHSHPPDFARKSAFIDLLYRNVT